MNTQNNNEQSEKEEEKSQARQDYETALDELNNNNFAVAAISLHNALIGFEQEGDENGVANASDKLGDICAGRGDTQLAMEHYDRAYKICEKHSDRFSLFAIEKKLAKLTLDSGRYEKAIDLYLDILDEYSALRNPQGSVDTLVTLAEIYIKAGKKEKAADAYRMAASIHSKFKHTRHAEELLAKAEAIA